MKYTNTKAFIKHLQESVPNHFSRIYFLLSKEDFERREGEKILLQHLAPPNTSDHQIIHFDGENVEGNTLLDALFEKSFFSDQRLICVHNADKLDKTVTEKLEEYFEKPCPRAYLIFSAPTLNKATKFYKKGEKAGVILEVEEEKPWEKENALISKVTEWAEKGGKKLDAQTAKFFIQYAGENPAFLRTEMEKLLCYTQEKDTLTNQDISSIVTKTNSENIWQLGDSIFQKNGTALKIAASLLKEGTPFFSLIRQIRSQFQSKLHICAILSEGGGPAEIQHKYPYMKGQILQQNIQTAKNYGMKPLQKGLLLIDEAELQAKNSALDSELLLERLIIKLIG